MAGTDAVIPGRSFRGSQWLASRHPLLWRTRLIPILVGLVIADVVLFTVGSLWVVRPTSIPTITEVSNLVSSLRIVAFLALTVWAALQIREGLGEWPVRHYVAVGACYAICCFGTLTTPIFLGAPFVGQIGASVTDEEAAQDYKDHEPFGFWACDERITDEAVAKRADEIRRVFHKYGLQTEPTLSDRDSWNPYCKENLPRLIVMDALGNGVSPLILRDRLQSLRAAKCYRTGDGPYQEMLFGNFVQVAMISTVLAFIMVVASLPRAFWSRRFGYHLEELSLPHFRLPQPKWLRRLDHQLVTEHPRVWATRLPTFLFGTLVYGGAGALGLALVVGTLFPAVRGWFTHLDETYAIAFYMGLGGILPASWAFAQRGIRLVSRSTYEDLAAVLAHSVTMLFLTLLFARLMGVYNESIIVNVALTFGCMTLVAGVYASKYCDIRWILSGFLTSLALALISERIPLTAIMLSTFFAAVVVVVAVGGVKLKWRSGRMAVLLLVSAPVLFHFIIVAINVFRSEYKGSIQGSFEEWCILAIFLVLHILVVLTSPALRRACYWPSTE